MAESQLDLEQQCVTAFKQGNHDQAVQLLPQLQQPGDVTTEFEFNGKSLPPNKDVTLLHLAAYHGWLDIIKTIQQHISMYDVRDSEGLTPLHYAAAASSENCLEMINYLISALGCDPNAKTTRRSLPLHIACRHGNLDTVKYLITEQKCNPNAQNNGGWTPLHWASQNGHMNIIQYLIAELGCDPKISSNDGLLPLHIASLNGHLNTVKYFISEQKLDPNICSQNGYTPLHYASEGGHLNIIQYLIIEFHCDPSSLFTSTCGNDNLLSQFPSIAGLFQILRQFLTTEKEVDGPIIQDSQMNVFQHLLTNLNKPPDSNGYLPLHIACLHGHLNVTNYLIAELNCDPNSRGMHGITPLHCASGGGHLKIIQYLISEHKCDPKTPDSDGDLPLHIACINGNLNVIEYFITKENCDPNSRGQFGSTPLHCASAGGHLNIIQYLINDLGCDPTIRDDNDDLPLHIACSQGCLNVIKYFASHQTFDKAIRGQNGYTPIHFATLNSQFDVLRYLIDDLGCDPTSFTYSIDVDSINKKKQFPIFAKFSKLFPHFADQRINSTNQIRSHHRILATRSDKDLQFAAIQQLINIITTKRSDRYLPIHFACVLGDLNMVKYFITEQNCKPTIPSEFGFTPLHLASIGGHMDIIKYLTTNRECNLTALNSFNILFKISPLDLACLSGHLNVVKYFIEEKKCFLTRRDWFKSAPLYSAIIGGHMDIIRYLITQFKFYYSNTRGFLLVYACLFGNVDIVKCFIELMHCDPIIQDSNGFTPLHYAVEGGHMNTIEYLITEQGCDLKTPNFEGTLPLHIGCRNGDLNIVKYFFTEKHSIVDGFLDESGSTPLHYATEGGHMNIIDYLITEQGCDPKTPNFEGTLPLHIACRNGDLNIVKYFIQFEQNCSQGCQSENGSTPLHYAAEGGHMSIIQYLINLGCEPETPNIDCDCPLHITCQNGHLEIVKYFIKEQNCSPDCVGENGFTPLHYAAEGGHLNIIQYLITELGCDCSIVNEDGRNILHLGSYYGHTHVIEWLLHNGKLNIMAEDYSGNTCIDLAGKGSKNQYGMLKLFQPFIKSTKMFPIHTFSKTVIVGNSAAGKTTLVKVITKRATTYFHRLIFGNIEQVKPNSAGIIMSYLDSWEAGKMVLYDLAGQAEYHSSHSAVMETVMQQSPATFINVIDLSNSEVEIRQQLNYWLNFIDSATSKTTNAYIIVVGSHADKCSDETRLIKSNLIKKLAERRIKRQIFAGMVFMDCRKISSGGMQDFIDQLHKTHQAIAARAPLISYYCHVLYAFLKSKPETAVCTLHDLAHLISLEESCPIPSEQQEFLEVLTALNDKGMIIFLKNEKELDASWIVVDIEAVLENIHGILFAPTDFLEYHEIASNTGIVHSSALQKLFPQYDIEMLTGFLQTLDLCHRVNLSGIATNLKSIGTSSDEQECVLFFPCFLSYQSKVLPSDNSQYSFGWCLCCRDQDDQFFTSRFLHVLLLRLAYTASSISCDEDTISPNYKRACNVWNNGISWDNDEGITTVVELVDTNRRVLLFMSKKDKTNPLNYIKQRSSVIKLIVDLQRQLSQNMTTTQYLISKALFNNSPIEDSHPPDTALFPMKNVAESMFRHRPYILSCTDKSHELFNTEDVLKSEPYYQLKNSSVCKLLDSSKAEELASQYLLDEVKIVCQAQELEQQSHLCLKRYVDKLSIFAGINPIVSLILLF